MLGMIRALTQVLQIWWNKDRIRVARSEGKLLRIGVGDCLLFDGKLFLVLSRRENDSLERPEVVYQLVEDGSDSADLFYLTYVIQTEQAKLCYAEKMIEFCIDQISVLSERQIAR